MRLLYRKNGFSLVEVLSVVAVVAVLLSLVIGLSKHVREKGNVRLTESTIDILVTAVELYYQDNSDTMPFETPAGADFSLPDFESAAAATTMVIFSGTHSEPDWSGEALYYFLDKSLNSRRIINTINSSLVSSFDSAGQSLIVDVDDSPVDMPRFVDAWGNTLRYRYTKDATFCVITSAGPDKNFGTADDITNTN